MFLRAADVTSAAAALDARKATTFFCSGVSQVIGNANHNSIVVKEPIQNIALEAGMHGLKAASACSACAFIRSCGANVRRVKIILHILLILGRVQCGRHTSMIVFGVRVLFCFSFFLHRFPQVITFSPLF